MIECDDGSLYTGVTTSISRRFREHAGRQKGARYFHGRAPVAVVFSAPEVTRSSAQRREASIKQLTRAEKLKLKQLVIYFR
jgi:putative endonuclease